MWAHYLAKGGAIAYRAEVLDTRRAYVSISLAVTAGLTPALAYSEHNLPLKRLRAALCQQCYRSAAYRGLDLLRLVNYKTFDITRPLCSTIETRTQ